MLDDDRDSRQAPPFVPTAIPPVVPLIGGSIEGLVRGRKPAGPAIDIRTLGGTELDEVRRDIARRRHPSAGPSR